MVNYKGFFRTKLRADVVIPKQFEFPLVVRLQNNQVMILWAATIEERGIWAQAFEAMIDKEANTD